MKADDAEYLRALLKEIEAELASLPDSPQLARVRAILGIVDGKIADTHGRGPGPDQKTV